MGRAGRRGQKWKNPYFYKLIMSFISKSNDQIFKNLTFLKTRDKTTSNKKNTPTPLPMGGPGEGGPKRHVKLINFRAASTSASAV